MRRPLAIALVLLLPTAALVGGSADASPRTPTLTAASTQALGSTAVHADMSGMDMSGMDMSGKDMSESAFDCDTMPRGRSTSSAARHGKLPVIRGCVSSDYVIRVSPETVTAGRYKFVVTDETHHHNWHMTGPGGVDVRTGVLFDDGKMVWKLNLVAGEFHVQCDPHYRQMYATLTVT